MNLRMLLLAIAVVSGLAFSVQAGKYNKQLSIGDAAPDWSGLEGVDETAHALKDLADKEVIVLTFTCNTCPYAVDYEDRLIALAKKFAAEGDQCAVVAINPNQVAGDLMPAMQERARLKRFNFPYLHDTASQQTAKSQYSEVTLPCRPFSSPPSSRMTAGRKTRAGLRLSN